MLFFPRAFPTISVFLGTKRISSSRPLHLSGLDLVLSHPGVGDGKQQSLLDTGPDLIDIDTAGDIVVGGFPPDL